MTTATRTMKQQNAKYQVTEAQDRILDLLGVDANNWPGVVAAFGDLAVEEIEEELGIMFPEEDNHELAQQIWAELNR